MYQLWENIIILFTCSLEKKLYYLQCFFLVVQAATSTPKKLPKNIDFFVE
jgi:hypothetical protein